MKHTKGPFNVVSVDPTEIRGPEDDWIAEVCFKQVYPNPYGKGHSQKIHNEEIANAKLFLLAPTAPHTCEDLTCPGDINRRKLEAAEKMAEACKAALFRFKEDGIEGYHQFHPVNLLHTALSVWEKAGKGEG